MIKYWPNFTFTLIRELKGGAKLILIYNLITQKGKEKLLHQQILQKMDSQDDENDFQTASMKQ